MLRHSLLSGLFENLERNARLRERIGLFEIGPVFLSSEEGDLPDEIVQLGIVLTGLRSFPGWQSTDNTTMDLFDLKGMVQALADGLHILDVKYETWHDPVFHPGKCARVMAGEQQIGVLGEVHPQVHERYDWPDLPVLGAWFRLDALLAMVPERYETRPVPEYPPVLEDLAVVVDETIPAEKVAELIRQAGGKVVANVRLFDVYRAAQLGPGKKSLAYSLAFQASDRTLTDKDVSGIRQRILRRLEQELGAKLRQ